MISCLSGLSSAIYGVNKVVLVNKVVYISSIKKYTLVSVGKSYFITLLLTINYVVGHVLT